MTNIKPFDPFRSERLVYRAVEDTPEDDAFVHMIQADAEAQSGASYGLLRPESQKASNDFKTHIAEKCLLGAIVCLAGTPPSPKEGGIIAGEPVGILCLKANPLHHAHHRWTDVSIDIARNHRSHGYGGEAITWGLWYGFQMAGLHRVQIQAFAFNEGALRLYEKLGFKQEGRQRDFMWFDGEWHDNVIFGMLEGEWREMQKSIQGGA
ncbi:putative GNAT family acetyltransferase [Xylariaceae sp. FL0016]|nr:putative GNAT family acetyltransferase [Xylariaceae sp. FL0016]